ncbi:MAG: gliding motility-associated C-terminal domain-containing protein, partial [Bacteroidota bacterium]
GDSARFTLSVIGATVYQWKKNGIIIPNATDTFYNIPQIALADSGDYWCIVSNPCGKDSVSAKLTVRNLSAPIAEAGTSQTICNGVSVILTASGGTSYSWSDGVQNGVSFIPTATTTYTVTAINSCGTDTDSVVVNVGSLPTAEAGTAQTVCAGTNVTLTASGGISYSWSGGVQNGVAFVPTATTTYTVTTTSSCGTATDSVVVTVNPLPIVNAGLDKTVCAKTNVMLTASGGISYSWSNGVTNGVAFTPSATTTYTVTTTNSCGTATDNVVITVNPLPIVNAGLDKTVCAGTNVTLTASGGTSYSWSGGVQNGVAFVPSATTTYTVTTTNSCGTASDNVVVTVNPLPTANAGKDTTIFIRGNGNAYLHGSGGTTYSWTPSTNLSCTNCANPIANPLTTTSYILEVTDSNGCTDKDTVTVFVNTECRELFVPSAFSPNDDGKNDYAVVHSPCIKTIDFSIYNRWGQRVFHTTDILITIDKTRGWNGKFNNKDMDPEVFYYVLNVELKNDPNVIKQFSGNITLVR